MVRLSLRLAPPYDLAIVTGIGPDKVDNRDGTIIGLVDLSDGNDTFLGGAGDERITDGRGDDFIDGAGGNDTLVCAPVGSSTPLTIDLSITTAQATGAGNDILIGIENVVSSWGNDTLKGSDADNSLQGMEGRDSLTGAVGNDTLDGGGGNDTLDGGDGFDTAVFDSSSGSFVDLNLTGAQNTGSGSDILISIENISSGDYDDTLKGNGGANILSGNFGNDTLRGNGGNDTLKGGEDDDLLYGGADDDTLFGDAGDDVLVAGSGQIS